MAEATHEFYNHDQIDNLFRRYDAPGDPPTGTKRHKIKTWLERADADLSVDVYALLGGLLKEFMERDLPESFREYREQVKRALAKCSLSYDIGGCTFGGALSTPTRSLSERIRERNIPAIEVEFERAFTSVEADPAAAVTAACAIVEAMCKVIIAEEGLQPPADQSIQPLWKTIQPHLDLDPGKTTNPDLRQILSGLTSIIHGVGALRTHAGSAHGGATPIAPRHARLAVHAAHTLVLFILARDLEALRSHLLSLTDGGRGEAPSGSDSHTISHSQLGARGACGPYTARSRASSKFITNLTS